MLKITKNTDGFVGNRVYNCPLSNINIGGSVVNITDEDTLYITL